MTISTSSKDEKTAWMTSLTALIDDMLAETGEEEKKRVTQLEERRGSVIPPEDRKPEERRGSIMTPDDKSNSTSPDEQVIPVDQVVMSDFENWFNLKKEPLQKEGVLKFYNDKGKQSIMYLYLFSKCLICATRPNKKKNQLEFKVKIELKFALVQDIADTPGNSST